MKVKIGETEFSAVVVDVDGENLVSYRVDDKNVSVEDFRTMVALAHASATDSIAGALSELDGERPLDALVDKLVDIAEHFRVDVNGTLASMVADKLQLIAEVIDNH